MEAFELNAEKRTETGTADSRRLRKQGRVPAIIYGGKGDPLMVTLGHNELDHHLENEAFFSHVIKIKVQGGKTEEAVLRGLQRHPARPFIEHADFLRVVANETLRMSVPLHFLGTEECPGVKVDGGIVQHVLNDVEVECLPRDLPEFIEVDLSALQLNEAVHLSELKLPEGVALVALLNADEDTEDATVASIQLPRAAVEQEEEEEVAAEEAEAAEDAATEEEAADEDGDEAKE